MKPTSNPLLYLDFDGVLHSDEVFMDFKRRIYIKGSGKLFEHCDKLIETLESHPDVKIVLSTTWVRVKGYGRALKRLPQPLQERVIGATWHSYFKGDTEMTNWWENSTRFQQIQRDVRLRKASQWLALDDDTEGWPESMESHLVACESEYGLSKPEVQNNLVLKLSKWAQNFQNPPTHTPSILKI